MAISPAPGLLEIEPGFLAVHHKIEFSGVHKELVERGLPGHQSKLETTTSTRCGLCGAELLPATSFCRQCGAAITPGSKVENSEQPTAILGKTNEATTQRLQARATGPAIAARASAPKRRTLVIGSALVLLIIGLLTVIAIVAMRNDDEAPVATQLIYPDAQTVIDMTNSDGSRTIQLQTPDSLDKVESWYQKNLRLTKTMRLTSASYVMKNDKVTINLASEDNKTNILIKQRP